MITMPFEVMHIWRNDGMLCFKKKRSRKIDHPSDPTSPNPVPVYYLS
jgi:hypothetical protein